MSIFSGGIIALIEKRNQSLVTLAYVKIGQLLVLQKKVVDNYAQGQVY